MKKLKRFSLALPLMLVLSATAMAGIIETPCGPAPPPPDSQQSTSSVVIDAILVALIQAVVR
jgi:hypothetical protein